jgi:hypothetical protein
MTVVATRAVVSGGTTVRVMLAVDTGRDERSAELAQWLQH